MLTRVVCTVFVSAAVMQGAAFAQGGTSDKMKGSEAGKTTSAGQTTSQTLPNQIEQKLKDQGFTNVEVVPGSYLVSAKGKDGSPVTMIIGPHSMTIFTVSTPGDRSTTGSGSSGSQSGMEKK